jgi:hypothetical protein
MDIVLNLGSMTLFQILAILSNSSDTFHNLLVNKMFSEYNSRQIKI